MLGKYVEIGLIIVLYNPSDDDRSNVIRLSKTYNGVIVDNSSCPSFSDSQIGKMHIISLGENRGIAEAQNIALRYLLHEREIHYLVFLDQDSRIELNYPTTIVEEYKRIILTCTNLALLGPSIDNIISGEEYRSAIHNDTELDDGFIVRRDVISSGSVISREALEKVGLNDASLFIDFVDFEWCWRAESIGYVCGITRNVHILHQVGHHELSFGLYKVIISAPVRYFYQYRNHLWLCRRGYIPMQWKIATGIKHFARLFYFPLCVKGGIDCWKNMLKGIGASFHRQILNYE